MLGAFSGYLGWVYYQQGKPQEAFQMLMDGEPLVKVFPLEHAVLCIKAKIQHLHNQSMQAKETLSVVKEMAEELQTKQTSALQKKITDTEQFLVSSPTLPFSDLYNDVASPIPPQEEWEDLQLEADELLEKGNIEERGIVPRKSLSSFLPTSAQHL